MLGDDFYIGSWLVEPRLGSIRRGDETAHVTPRAMAVLVYLAEADGAIVARNEILDAVWPRMEVTQDALSQCIVELRKAFRDDAKNPQVIETVPKRGVRLLVPVAAVELAGEKQRGRSWLRAALGAVAVLIIGLAIGSIWLGERLGHAPSPQAGATDRSVAVLPLSFDSAANEDIEFFANGLHDQLLTQLAKLSGVDRSIDYASVAGYRDTQKSAREIGRELHVATVFKGRLQRVGNAVRIIVNLMDVETGASILSESYDRALSMESLLAVQSELAVSIASALEASITDEELARLREVPTRSERAEEFYLRGNELFRRSNNRPQDLPLALEQYERATDEDPKFALAWARAGIMHTGLYFFHIDRTRARLDKAKAAIQTAFDLVPGLPEAHLAWANYLARGLDDYDQALAEFAVAQQLNPNDADVYLMKSSVERRVGNWEQAIRDLERASELSPRNVLYMRAQAVNYLFLRDYARADEYLDRILDFARDDAATYVDKAAFRLYRDGDTTLLHQYEESPPAPGYTEAFGSAYARWLAAIYDHDYSHALAVLDSTPEEMVTGQGVNLPKALLKAHTHALSGNVAQARPLYEDIAADLGRDKADTPSGEDDANTFLVLAEAQAGLGSREALQSAERARSALPSSNQGVERPMLNLAIIFSVLVPLEEQDRAFGELDEYLKGRGHRYSIEALRKDPRLEPIRDDPRFAALVEKYQRQ